MFTKTPTSYDLCRRVSLQSMNTFKKISSEYRKETNGTCHIAAQAKCQYA